MPGSTVSTYVLKVAVAIGLVGAGARATHVYAPALASSDSVRFAGVWARRSDAATALAAQHDVAAYSRFDDLLDNCDALAFAVPAAVQAELVPVATAHNMAVLLECPIAADLAGAAEMTRDVDVAGVVSQLALIWRYADAVRQFLAAEVPRTRPQGGVGRLVSCVSSRPSAASAWRLERDVLLDQGPYLIDLLDAALGNIVGESAHGDPRGWVGLLLEHERGRSSEASLYASAEPVSERAEVEVFGPGGSAAIDCADSVGPSAVATMFSEFATAVERKTAHELDVHRGLHLQQVIGAAVTDLVTGV
jgi:predicted dehydrogenase